MLQVLQVLQELSPGTGDWRDTKHLLLSSKGPSDKATFNSSKFTLGKNDFIRLTLGQCVGGCRQERGSFTEATLEGVTSMDVSPMETQKALPYTSALSLTPNHGQSGQNCIRLAGTL